MKRHIRLPFGYHIVKDATGNPVGRPRKPIEQLSRTGLIKRRRADLYALLADPEAEVDVGCSGPDDWARERRERKEAMERVRNSPISRWVGSRG